MVLGFFAWSVKRCNRISMFVRKFSWCLLPLASSALVVMPLFLFWIEENLLRKHAESLVANLVGISCH